MIASVTGVVIARDEERCIGRCLDSLEWTDARFVLVDDRTSDATAAIARARRAGVALQHFADYASQRNAALSHVQTEWALFVDADEVIPVALADEIRRTLASQSGKHVAGFWIPRKNMIWGAQIRHGGWYPDYQLRLLKVGQSRYDPHRLVHEVVELEGGDQTLVTPLVHYNYDSLGQFLHKQRYYSRLQARLLADQGIHARPRNFVLQPLREFRRRFIELQGWKDGWRGLALSALLAWYTLETYVRLRWSERP